MEKIKNIKDNFSVNQWVALNRFLFIYKAVGVALMVLCLVLGAVCMLQANKSPLVILASENENFYFQSRDAKTTITEKDLTNFVKGFVERYYNWQELNPEKIVASVGPLATDGFKENIFLNLRARKEKEFVGKKISQAVAGLSVQVSKESTMAVFDVVLRVDGIPLIVPTQIALQLVKGAASEWNPTGLYVNAITQFDRK